MKSSSLCKIVAFHLCGNFIPASARGSSSSERQIVTILPKDEPKVYGIFQKHGRSAETFAVPKGSSPFSGAISDVFTSAAATQLPLQLSSRRRHVSHILASILTVCVFGSLVYCWKFAAPDERMSGVLVVMLSLVPYLTEAATSSTARYLRNALTPDGVDEYLDSMKAAIPRIVWDIECFHYRTVQRVDYYTSNDNDKNANKNRNVPHVRTETEKIVTHKASAEYSFDR